MTHRAPALILALLCCNAILFAVSSAAAEPAGRQIVTRINEGWPLDDFSLADPDGQPFTRDNLLGKWTFVVSGDTRCGEPCKSCFVLAAMRERIARTPKAPTTQVLFLSLGDDSAQALRDYLAPYPGVVGITGCAPFGRSRFKLRA
jgi:protein SCO1